MLLSVKTLDDIQSAIIRRASLQDNQATRDKLVEPINTSLQSIIFEEPYKWSGDTRQILLPKRFTEADDAGVSITNGSDIVTGLGSIFKTDSHTGWKLRLGGDNNVYKILAIDDVSQAVIIDSPFIGTTNADASFQCWQDEFALFPDFQGLRRFRVIDRAFAGRPTPIGITELEMLRDRSPFRVGAPDKYTIWGNGHYYAKTWNNFQANYDFWEDNFETVASRSMLHIYPGIRINDLLARIRYTITAPLLSLPNDEPIIPHHNRQVLVWKTLIDHFITNRDPQIKAEWKGEYNTTIKKMAGDIETVDDELRLFIDKNDWRRRKRYYFSDYKERQFE